MIDDNRGRRKHIVAERMIVVDLCIYKEPDRLVRELFDPGGKFLCVKRGLTGVDDDRAFLSKNDAAGRVPFLGGKDVDPVFDFGKTGSQILGPKCRRRKNQSSKD